MSSSRLLSVAVPCPVCDAPAAVPCVQDERGDEQTVHYARGVAFIVAYLNLSVEERYDAAAEGVARRIEADELRKQADWEGLDES